MARPSYAKNLPDFETKDGKPDEEHPAASLPEVKGLIVKAQQAIEELRKTNDERIAKLEQGRGTAELEAKIAKVNADVDATFGQVRKAWEEKQKEHETKLALLETALKRGGLGADGDGADVLAVDECWARKGWDPERIPLAYKRVRRLDEGEKTYRQKFVAYLRDQVSEHEMKRYAIEFGEERKAMSIGSDPDGGYFVTPDTSGRMIRRIFDTSDVRAQAAVQAISTDSLEGGTDLNQATAGWTSELGTRTGTGTPQVGKWKVPVQEMYAMPAVSQRLLDDAEIDVEAWLGGKLGDLFGRTESTAFVSGDGIGKPRGITSYTVNHTADKTRAWGQMYAQKSGTNGSFGTDPAGLDNLLALIHTLKPVYRRGAIFAMNRSTLGKVRTLKTGGTAGNYGWLPTLTAPAGTAVLPSGSLFGFPVYEWEDLPDYTTTGALAIVFGNVLEGYQIVDRIGVRVLRDPYSSKPNVLLYTTRRVGGDVVNFEAIKFMQFSA